jgi:hypothetical protein
MGSLFMFAADVVHSGMDCPEQIINLRFHLISATPEFNRGGNTQGWLESKKERIKWTYKVGCN